MHLPDRRSGHGLALELEEEPLDRVAEILLDHTLCVLERERTHVVLEPAQLGDDVGRDDVRTGRQELAELDEGRPELVEELAQVPAALGRARLLCSGGEPGLRRAAGQQVGELVRLEEVAEAVTDHHLGDLGQAAERSGCGLRHDRQCDTAVRLRQGAAGTSCSTRR